MNCKWCLQFIDRIINNKNLKTRVISTHFPCFQADCSVFDIRDNQFVAFAVDVHDFQFGIVA